jgi:hypothetical protein
MESPRHETKPYLFPTVLVLFLLALFLRLVEAQTVPFTRVDADLAWQALEISQLQPSGTSPIALYTGLTGLLFWISSTSNTFARLIPALFGSILVFVPYILVDRTKSIALLGLSLLLALDPILIVYSRQLSGPMLAISTLVWTLVFLHKHKSVAAGIAFGMAILAGKYFWIAIMLAGLYLLINHLIDKAHSQETVNLYDKPSKTFFVSALLSSVLISSSFLLNPSGMTGIASGLVDLFAVTSLRSLPLYLPLFILLTYSLYLLLPFGKALRHRSGHSSSLHLVFLIGLLLLTALFQNHLPGLYAFIEVFLILIIARNVEAFRPVKSEFTLVSLVSFVFYAVILTFALLSFQAFAQRILAEYNFITDVLPILLALALIIISYLLIGLGWGFAQSKPALQAALMLIALFFSLGFSFSQTWNDATSSQLLFTNSEILFPDSPLKNELAIFINNKAINPSADSYKIEKYSSMGENWEFKDFYGSANASALPAFIINDSVTESGLMAAYRGTSLVSARRLNFSNKAYTELIHMISSKTLPVSDISRTLWVQALLFPGGK